MATQNTPLHGEVPVCSAGRTNERDQYTPVPASEIDARRLAAAKQLKEASWLSHREQRIFYADTRIYAFMDKAERMGYGKFNRSGAIPLTSLAWCLTVTLN